MNFFIYLVTNSFQLDLHLWNKSALTPNEKIEFLIKKYWLLIKHMILKQKYVSGLSECTFKGKKVYYDSYYGFAGFQRILSSHNNILGGAGVGKANIIIDVGANVGFFSLFMTYKFPSAKIYSFEPVPAAFEALNKNA